MSDDTLSLSLDLVAPRAADEPVESLGMRFPDEAARRAFFHERLREKLRDPEFRRQKDVPDADDEQILALSDPPYYTACPNPLVEDWFAQQARGRDTASTDEYRREPFAVDVSDGKADPINTAHAYHTKVPYKAIVPPSCATRNRATWCSTAPAAPGSLHGANDACADERNEHVWAQRGLYSLILKPCL